jgi:hypothetical protein
VRAWPWLLGLVSGVCIATLPWPTASRVCLLVTLLALIGLCNWHASARQAQHVTVDPATGAIHARFATHTVEGQLSPEGFVATWGMGLAFDVNLPSRARARRHVILITPGMVDDETYRRLQIALRWRFVASANGYRHGKGDDRLESADRR